MLRCEFQNQALTAPGARVLEVYAFRSCSLGEHSLKKNAGMVHVTQLCPEIQLRAGSEEVRRAASYTVVPPSQRRGLSVPSHLA